jgi:hypothetical protein
VARALLALYVLGGLVILLQPSAAIASHTISDTAAFLARHGAPATLTARRVEDALNAGLFVPYAALAVLAAPRLQWTTATIAAFGASLAIELCQGLFLPARTCEAVDVVSNTSGALVGAVLGSVVRARLRSADHS